MLASICTKPWWLCIWQGNYKNTSGKISWWADVHNILKPQDLTNCETGNPITETLEGYVVILALPWQCISSQIILICSLSCISHLLTFLAWSHVPKTFCTAIGPFVLVCFSTSCCCYCSRRSQAWKVFQELATSLTSMTLNLATSTLFRMMQNTTIY